VERIFIIGGGVVGKATAHGFTRMGHDVTVVDIVPERVDLLCAHGLNAQLGLDLTGEPESYLFLTLPTPHVERRYDLSAFECGVRDVGTALRKADAVHTVVVRSTVPPRTTDDLVKPLLEEVSGKREGVGFALASNPEFLRASSAEDDFLWPRVTVVGARSKRVQERLAALLSPFGGELRVYDNPATAEMIKCAHNIFNATKISFWNEMWRVCRDLGIEHDDVAGAVARSAEASYNPLYGIRGGAPYGGVCLPKDTKGFLGFAASRKLSMPLLDAVVSVNEDMAALVAAELADWEHVPLSTSARAATDPPVAADPSVDPRFA
jgi:UDPglucose 6-dehydrogenase